MGQHDGEQHMLERVRESEGKKVAYCCSNTCAAVKGTRRPRCVFVAMPDGQGKGESAMPLLAAAAAGAAAAHAARRAARCSLLASPLTSCRV